MYRSIVPIVFCGVAGLAGVSQSMAGGSESPARVHELLRAHDPLISGIEARSFAFAAAPDPGHIDSTLLCRDPTAGLEGPSGDDIDMAQPASASLAPQAEVSSVGIAGALDHVLSVRVGSTYTPDVAFDDPPAPPVAVPPPLSVWGGLALMAALAMAGIRRRMRFA